MTVELEIGEDELESKPSFSAEDQFVDLLSRMGALHSLFLQAEVTPPDMDGTWFLALMNLCPMERIDAAIE